MVRLKVAVGKSNDYILGFQFQYGTIKRAFNENMYHKDVAFQFQYGTIKRKQSIGVNSI